MKTCECGVPINPCGDIVRTKNWPGSCIKPSGHKKRCKGIESGMTAAEAAKIAGCKCYDPTPKRR